MPRRFWRLEWHERSIRTRIARLGDLALRARADVIENVCTKFWAKEMLFDKSVHFVKARMASKFGVMCFLKDAGAELYVIRDVYARRAFAGNDKVAVNGETRVECAFKKLCEKVFDMWNVIVCCLEVISKI